MMTPCGPLFDIVDAMNRFGMSAGAIDDELIRQFDKWGDQLHAPDVWFVIASEEWGEVAKALVEGDAVQAQAEIVQTIACLVRLSAALAGGGSDDA